MKSPAFRFYPDDFIGGTVDMTPSEVGAYIRLLCYQWNRGSTPVEEPEKLAIIAGCHVSSAVIAKFPNGKNPRLELERQKQADYRALQADKGKKSAAARANRGSTAVQPEGQPKVNLPFPFPFPFPSVEREQSPGSPPSFADRPSIDEVQSHAATIGLAPWKAKDWFDEMEGCGWLDHLKRPVANWRAILNRVRTKWEADGRPNSPPQSLHVAPGSTNGKNGTVSHAQSLILAQDELKRVDAAIKSIRDSYDPHQDMTADDRSRLKSLKARSKQLKTTLGFVL